MMLFVVGWVQAQQRVIYTINDGWKFTKGSPFEAQLDKCDDSSWETVNIPHTWNDKDADDETPGFYRGPAWYRKQLFVDKSQEGRQVIIYFEGANQEGRNRDISDRRKDTVCRIADTAGWSLPPPSF